MKNKGFSLIELLAVIIILGLLMLIAIPSVSNYINESKKNTYVATINEFLRATSSDVKKGKLQLNDKDTTYYVPSTCIEFDNGEAKSPYGKFDPAYAVVRNDGVNYNYYFVGKDVHNMGVPTLIKEKNITTNSILANIDEVDTDIGIKGTNEIVVFNSDCTEELEKKPVRTYAFFDDDLEEEEEEETTQEENIAMFDTGKNVNKKMKLLAGQTNPTENVKNENIIYFKRYIDPIDVNTMSEENIVSTYDSETPIYMWFYNDTIFWWTEAKKVYFNEDSSYFFSYLYKANSIELKGLDTSYVTNMSYLFNYCYNVTKLDVIKFDTSSVTNMDSMFNYCYNLIELNLVNFDTKKVTIMSNMFTCCHFIKELNLMSFDTSQVTKMNSLFGECRSLVNLNISTFDTSKVTNMASMFFGCAVLTSLDLTHFNTSNVTNMSHMFIYCLNLKYLNVSSFDTSNVTNMNSMFDYCWNVKEIDVSHFDTSKVTDMSSMFNLCSSVTTLDTSHFDTSKVKHFSNMFYRCHGLKTLDLRNFDVSGATSLSSMFSQNNGLVRIDLSGWDTSNIRDMSNMFEYCPRLTTIIVSDSFVTTNVTNSNYIFKDSSNLVGGSGTKYDASMANDKTYARIDEGESKPGLFTSSV